MCERYCILCERYGILYERYGILCERYGILTKCVQAYFLIKVFIFKPPNLYLTQNNQDFLEDTSLSKVYASSDELLRPYMVSNIEYDMIMGSDDATTRLAYEVNYRNYFLVTEGSVSLKLSPPKNAKYFHSVKDYELQEYYSNINPWNPDKTDISNISKAKFLDVTLQKGQIIYIPAYWWYSIKLGKGASVAVFKYRTYMNMIAILPDILIGVLQRQNTKTKTIQEYNSNTEIV